MSIQESLTALATQFVDSILAAVRAASVDEFTALAIPTYRDVVLDGMTRAGKPGRLPRRSADEIDIVASMVATLLRNHPAGLRSEQIRAELGLDVRELPRVLKQGLADKSFQILSGQKRATVYGVARASAGAKKSRKARPAKKAKSAKKPAKRARR